MTLWDQSRHFWRKSPLTHSTAAFLCQKWCVIWSEGCIATLDNLGFWGLLLASYTLNVNQHHVKTDQVTLITKRGLNVIEPFASYYFVILFLTDVLKSLHPWKSLCLIRLAFELKFQWCSALCFYYTEPTQGSQNRLWKSCLWLGRTPVLTLKQMWYLRKGPAVSTERIKY